MDQLNNFLSSQQNVKMVGHESELKRRYLLFQHSQNQEHSNQFYLLKTHHQGFFEKICKICKECRQELQILFYIDENNYFQLLIYILRNLGIQNINYLPLDHLMQSPQKRQQIYKVIHNKSYPYQQGSSLLLLPNENIVLGRFSIDNIPIQIPCKIYYNGQDWYELNFAIDKYRLSSKKGLEKQSYYYGEINDRLNPINLGYFENPQFKISAFFADGFFSSEIIIQNIQDIQEIQSRRIEKKNEKGLQAICYWNENLIDFYTFKTILEGRWVNQKVMDFYLDNVCQEFKIINQKKIETGIYKNYLINSCDCADIFSSDIFDQQFYSEQKWQNYQQQYQIDITSFENRYIFALNIKKSHFISIVLQQDRQKKIGNLYLMDSIPNYFTKEEINIGIKNIQSLFPHLQIQQEFKKVNIQIQRNGFDCGIHCIYNSILVFKNFNDCVEKINFKILDLKMISNLRRQIYMIMFNNYTNWLKN